MTPGKTELPAGLVPIHDEFALPPFGRLAQSALTVDALVLALLLLTNKVWLALGALAGASVGLAVFWSLHLITRRVVAHFVDMEAERRLGRRNETNAAVRRSSLWRLAGMLTLKYIVLGLVMFVVCRLAKDHLIPFLLAFIGTFALTQLAIISTAARRMRAAKVHPR